MQLYINYLNTNKLVHVEQKQRKFKNQEKPITMLDLSFKKKMLNNVRHTPISNHTTWAEWNNNKTVIQSVVFTKKDYVALAIMEIVSESIKEWFCGRATLE